MAPVVRSKSESYRPMVPPVEFRFHIDAFSPEVIPMERLGAYMVHWAVLMGETRSVHFARLEGGSTSLVAKSDWEAAPKVRRRVAEARANEGPDEPKQAKRRIEQMLSEDNASATVYESPADNSEPKKLLYFPGAKASAKVEYGPFRQPGTFSGIPIVIGGETDPVPVHIKDNDIVHNCRASRDIAKEIAPYLFTTPIRIEGFGTWFRSRDGEWEMRRFSIHRFEKLRHESVADAAARLQAIGTRLQALEDPIGELLALQNDDENGVR